MAKIVFMGTPEFAVPTLVALHKEFGVSAVVTNPEKPQGRGRILLSSPVKIIAKELEIPIILQPTSLRDEEFRRTIEEINPDIIVVVAFRILPSSVYSLAVKGAFNVHGSLLPKYRGAAPVQWAIIRDEKVTGVSTFLLNDSVDTGNVLLQKECMIPEDCTGGELFELLKPLSVEIAVETCRGLLDGSLSPSVQDDAISTSAPKIFPEMTKIRWEYPAKNIACFINGVSPAPGAWILWNAKRCKILRARVSRNIMQLAQGEFAIVDDGLHIGAGDGNSIEVMELKIEGKGVQECRVFLHGYKGEYKGFFDTA